jgi:hypothetical protein
MTVNVIDLLPPCGTSPKNNTPSTREEALADMEQD